MREEFICSEIEKYNVDDKIEYISRIKNDADLTASFFEIIVKLFIEKHDYKASHHVKIENVRTKPDFYISDNNVYLECVCIKEKDAIRKNRIEQHRFEVELARLLPKGDYYIDIEFDKFYIPKNLNIKKHMSSIIKWINSCIINKANNDIHYFPNTSIQLIFFYEKGYHGPIIPAISSGILCIGNVYKRMRDKLSKKAKKIQALMRLT